MQASKIKVGEVYAVHVSSQLSRFRVTEIVTTRNVGATYNTIIGEVLDRAGSINPGAKMRFEPANLLGPYTEHAELAERERRINEEKERKAQQELDRAEAIFTAFLKLLNFPHPKKVKEYRVLKYQHDEPFRLDYSNTIEINREGMEILARFFKIDQQQQEDNQDGATVINMK